MSKWVLQFMDVLLRRLFFYQISDPCPTSTKKPEWNNYFQLKLLLHRKGRSCRVVAGSRVALACAHAQLAIAALGKCCCWQVWKQQQQLRTTGAAGLGGAGQPAAQLEQALVVSVGSSGL